MLKSIKAALKTTPLYRTIVNRRVAKARRFLEYANMYPEAQNAILEDFRFSISRDYRGILQVLNIEECIRHIAKDVLGAFVETGVFTGGASAFALKSMMRNATVREYWGFDSFEGMPKPTEHDGAYAKKWVGADPSTVNASDYQLCLEYLRSSGYPEEKIHLIKGWFQDTLPLERERIGQIAILRMDGDFYESTKVVLEQLYEQVVPGGAVIIDDYGSFEGCRKAVDDFLRGSKFIHYVEHGVRFFIK